MSSLYLPGHTGHWSHSCQCPHYTVTANNLWSMIYDEQIKTFVGQLNEQIECFMLPLIVSTKNENEQIE